jgi:hypothetical protein
MQVPHTTCEVVGSAKLTAAQTARSPDNGPTVGPLSSHITGEELAYF